MKLFEGNAEKHLQWKLRTTSIMQRRHNLKRAQIVKLYIIAQKSVSIAHVWPVNGITV